MPAKQLLPILHQDSEAFISAYYVGTSVHVILVANHIDSYHPRIGLPNNIISNLVGKEIFTWQSKQNKQLSFYYGFNSFYPTLFTSFLSLFHLLHIYVNKFWHFYCLKRNKKMCDSKVSSLSFFYFLFCLVVWEFVCLSTWLSLLS